MISNTQFHKIYCTEEFTLICKRIQHDEVIAVGYHHKLLITASVNLRVPADPPISAVFSSGEPSLMTLKTALTILHGETGTAGILTEISYR